VKKVYATVDASSPPFRSLRDSAVELTPTLACEILFLGMRISAKGEYAAKAVLYLSLKYPQVVTIHEIAENHNIPLKYLEQILLILRRAGLLSSHRGVRGGYTLARRPEEISIGEVLRVVDGKFSESSCVELDLRSHYTCPDANACGLKQVWQDVQSAVEKILFETTFDEVRKRTLAGVARPGGYVAYEL
jgi:Rrf2 family transcriptional regulator, cysteine metabolism repressor